MNTSNYSFLRSGIFTQRTFWVVVVTVAMGSLGALSEVVNAGRAIGKGHKKRIVTRSLHVSVHPDGANGANAEMTLSQWPNGSVWIQGSAWKGNTVLTANDWKTASGDINVGAGVATANGSAAGTLWDFAAGAQPTPVLVDVAMEVLDTSTVWSLRGEYEQSGLVVKDTWDAPSARVARLNVEGQEDVTLDGGAMSLSLDSVPPSGPVSFIEGKGGLGHLKQNTHHTVDIIK